MNRIKSIFTGEHKNFAWFCVVALTVFLAAWTFGPGNTFIHWFKAHREIVAQERMAEKYRKEISDMERRYQDLNTNRDSLEKFAREQFGFTDNKEDIYIIPAER